jgi:hypothetical protein
LLTTIRLSHGDDPRGVVAAGRVRDHDGSASEQTQCDQPRLSMFKTLIHECDAWAAEYRDGIFEGQTMLGKVAEVLRFVPFVLHYSVALFVTTDSARRPSESFWDCSPEG